MDITQGQITDRQQLAVLTGEPNTWLLIYSGIATQRLRAEGYSGFLGIESGASSTEATVNVTIDNISGVLLQSVTTASMSNILEENNWGQWIVWSTNLSLRPNGDLVLTAKTEVIGEGDTEFYSFFYHVDAKVVLDEASISGTIRWSRDLVTPLLPPHFAIEADVQVPGGPEQFTTSRVEATGLEGPINTDDPGYFYVPYKITGALLGKELRVSVNVLQKSFAAPAFGSLVAGQISGPKQILLTSTNRHAVDVNFEMISVRGPA